MLSLVHGPEQWVLRKRTLLDMMKLVFSMLSKQVLKISMSLFSRTETLVTLIILSSVISMVRLISLRNSVVSMVISLSIHRLMRNFLTELLNPKLPSVSFLLKLKKSTAITMSHGCRLPALMTGW